MSEQKVRCNWGSAYPEELIYHDTEWGTPCFDDRVQFEFLVLESAQAGLSWRTVLLKRQGYRELFAGFDPVQVAEFGPKEMEKLLLDPRIIRNRKKIEAAIGNARCFLEVQARYGSFCNYLWDFVDGRPLLNHWKDVAEIPAQTALSDKIAKDMKQKGFRFLGSIVIYSHLQATGLINDHTTDCFRHAECQKIFLERAGVK